MDCTVSGGSRGARIATFPVTLIEVQHATCVHQLAVLVDEPALINWVLAAPGRAACLIAAAIAVADRGYTMPALHLIVH